MKVAVIGAGIVGLSTALQLKHEFRNAELTVIASDFDKTVSYVAPGIFRIGSIFYGPTEQITREWVCDSYEYYDDIRRSAEASIAGVASVSGYFFANSSPDAVKSIWLENLVPIYRRAKEEEFQLVKGDWKYGSFFTTLIIQNTLHLPWAREKLKERGVKLETRKVDSLKELVCDWDLIVNCTGLGARYLCNDKSLVPERGQVVRIKAPWVKTFFYGEVDAYIIPGFNGLVTLGGTRNLCSANEEVCPQESTVIKERCKSLLPGIGKTEVVKELVGLRPYREKGVRVEAERISNGSSKAILVHNYGHGGVGVALAPGTSKHAVEFAREMHKSSFAKL